MAWFVRWVVFAVTIAFLLSGTEAVAIVCTCIPDGTAPNRFFDCADGVKSPWSLNVCHRVPTGCNRAVPFAYDCPPPPNLYINYMVAFDRVLFHNTSDCSDAPSVSAALSPTDCVSVGPTGWRTAPEGLWRSRTEIGFAIELSFDELTAVRNTINAYLSQRVSDITPVPNAPSFEIRYPTGGPSNVVAVDMASPAPDQRAVTLANAMSDDVSDNTTSLYRNVAAAVAPKMGQRWGGEVIKAGPVESFGAAAPPPAPPTAPSPSDGAAPVPADRFAPTNSLPPRVPGPQDQLIPQNLPVSPDAPFFPVAPVAPRSGSGEASVPSEQVAIIVFIVTLGLCCCLLMLGVTLYILRKRGRGVHPGSDHNRYIRDKPSKKGKTHKGGRAARSLSFRSTPLMKAPPGSDRPGSPQALLGGTATSDASQLNGSPNQSANIPPDPAHDASFHASEGTLRDIHLRDSANTSSSPQPSPANSTSHPHSPSLLRDPSIEGARDRAHLGVLGSDGHSSRPSSGVPGGGSDPTGSAPVSPPALPSKPPPVAAKPPPKKLPPVKAPRAAPQPAPQFAPVGPAAPPKGIAKPKPPPKKAPAALPVGDDV